MGWERNLSAKIAAKADALVNKAQVNSAVNSGKPVSEAQIIEGVALAVADVRLGHRADAGMGRRLCVAMLAELEAQTGNLPGLKELGDLLRAPNDSGTDRLNDIYRAVISLPERSKTLKAQAEALRHFIGMEREAYNIASEPGRLELTGADGKPLVPDLTKDPAEATKRYLAFLAG